MKAKRSFLYFFMYLTVCSYTITPVLTQISVDSLDQNVNWAHQDKDINLRVTGLIYLVENIDEIKTSYQTYPDYLAKIYETIANSYYAFGDHNESEEYAIKALAIIENNNDPDTFEVLVRIHCLLGILQKVQDRHKAALNQYEKALRLAGSSKDSLYVVNNLANLYRDQQNYESAIQWYEKGLALTDKLASNRLDQRAKLLGNLGSAQIEINPEVGFINLKEALNMAEQGSGPDRKFSISRHILKYHRIKEDSIESRNFAQVLLELSGKVSNPSYEHEALKLAIESNVASRKDIIRHLFLSDSIVAADKEAENKFGLFKHDKVQEEKLRIKAENKTQLLVLALIIVALLFIGVYLFIINRSKQKQTQAVFNTEQRIASEIHDGVANDIFQTMSKIQAQEYSKEDVLEDLDAIYNDTRNISKANQGLEAEQDFADLITDLLSSFQSGEMKIISKDLKTLDWSALGLNKREALHKVLRELLVNTLKHSQASAVVVAFSKQGSDYAIRYQDNGKGGVVKPKGGLRHAESRIEAVQGRITFESSPNSGVVVLIEL